MVETVYPNARNCAELTMHVWLYYRGAAIAGASPRGATYRCQRCDYTISKSELKEGTDNA